MDKSVGIKKEIDSLGRIVVPKELRERYALSGEVELVATRDGVLVRNPEFVLVRVGETNFELCSDDK